MGFLGIGFGVIYYGSHAGFLRCLFSYCCNYFLNTLQQGPGHTDQRPGAAALYGLPSMLNHSLPPESASMTRGLWFPLILGGLDGLDFCFLGVA